MKGIDSERLYSEHDMEREKHKRASLCAQREKHLKEIDTLRLSLANAVCDLGLAIVRAERAEAECLRLKREKREMTDMIKEPPKGGEG